MRTDAIDATRRTAAGPAANWDSNRTYAVPVESPTANVEMANIYEDDQQARQNGFATRADWEAIEKADRVRHESVASLLRAGALHAADDHRKAAFVFQHGERSDDYLLAHTLALIAVAQGDQGAAWIAAATLDRHLQCAPVVASQQLVAPGSHQSSWLRPFGLGRAIPPPADTFP